jgi:outer membrane lipoprotein-sorting protein
VNARIGLFALGLTLFATSACAPALVSLPTGSGSPFTDIASAYDQATAHCRDVRTMAAILALSGRVGEARVRARVDAGFEAPGRVRLELPAPGKPLFVFVASGGKATLVLPRDGQVLRNATPEATLDALAGVALGSDELRAVVSGCGYGVGSIANGRAYDSDWAAGDVGQSTAWLRQAGAGWQLVAVTRGALDVRYADFVDGRPMTIRLRARPSPPGDATDLTIRLNDVDINQPINPEAFQAEIPESATPLTLEELRRNGPLGRR